MENREIKRSPMAILEALKSTEKRVIGDRVYEISTFSGEEREALKQALLEEFLTRTKDTEDK